MRYVIVGGGVAGVTAAIDLARLGAGQIDVYSAEPYPYYYRPRLPYFLAEEVPLEDLYYRPSAWYIDNGIGLHLETRVNHLDIEQKHVVLDSGKQVDYDRLLLATGGVPFVPKIEGTEREGVFCLRTLDDALAIKEYISDCQRVVVIGGGLLGLETAKGLTEAGLSVTTLEYDSRLCPRQLDQGGAEVFQRLVEEIGIGVGLHADVTAIEGKKRDKKVVLRDGREYPAQVVVIAAGVRCMAELAVEAGLNVSNGCSVVDEYMATSAPGVYCAGDAACFQGRTWGLVPVARAQAQVAAANMAGDRVVYEEQAPTATLKIAGIDLSSIGQAVVQGLGFAETHHSNVDAGFYAKLVFQEGVPVGAVVVGDRDLSQKLDKLVAEGAKLGLEEARELVKGSFA
jgi:nitrite reductase (NADH) large subunit